MPKKTEEVCWFGSKGPFYGRFLGPFKNELVQEICPLPHSSPEGIFLQCLISLKGLSHCPS